MGPLAVDEPVRMAAHMFWYRRPGGNKSVDAAEAAVRSALEEVLEDVRRGPAYLDAGNQLPPEGKSPDDMMGPAGIRRMLRQAAGACFGMLPPNARTPERVQQELHRIVDRLFRELREDARAFGLGDPSGQHAE
jgi:hypothetical protein